MFQRRLLLSLILLSVIQPASFGAASRQNHSSQNTQPSPPAKTTEPKAAEALPTLEQILDKYVQAIGGKAAVQAPTSRVMKGTISLPSMGADGSIEIYAKAPNKELTEWASDALGASRVGFNGSVAWQEEDGEIKDMPIYPKKDADFYLPIKLRELYPRIEFKGKEKLGNAEAYRLEAPRAGNPKRWYFDSKTGLLLRTEVRNPEGKLLRSEAYEDYRAVDGVKIAFTTRQIDEDGLEIVIKLSEVKHNVSLDDARFEKPGAK